MQMAARIHTFTDGRYSRNKQVETEAETLTRMRTRMRAANFPLRLNVKNSLDARLSEAHKTSLIENQRAIELEVKGRKSS